MRIRKTKNRHGLTLVFVVSMIVLFLLMGTTFLIIANDYFRAAKKRGTAELYTIDRAALVQRAFYDIVRGSDLTDVDSPMRGIDLLSDQYGYGYKASIQTAAPVDAGRLQLIQLQLHTVSRIDSGYQILGLRSLLADAAGSGEDYIGGIPNTNGLFDYPFGDPRYRKELDTPGYFAGQVLTFISGPAKGVSARIVDYTVTIDASGDAIRKFVIVPERLPNGTSTPFDNTTGIASLGDVRDPVTGRRVNPSQVIINGRAFSGFGSGIRRPTTPPLPPSINQLTINKNWAFRPNHARYNLASGGTSPDLFFTQYATMPNAVNEPYDAFDHDNIFLAQNNLASDPAASYNPIQMAPANHSTQTPEHNRYSFRPVFQWEDPPGSGIPASNNTANENFPNVVDVTDIPYPLELRPLDVDNDFDGRLDSVWIDMGFGVVTTRDGRLVKPLVATMVLDLDSRLNVNAHGTFADAQARATLDAGGFMTRANLLGPNSATAADSFSMPRGLGWGPPEISLAALLLDYRPLLIGYTSTSPADIFPFDSVPVLPGRYGYDRFPGNSYFDAAAQFRFSDHPSFGTVGGSFKRYMDIQGRFATGFPAAYETHTIIPDPLNNPGLTIDVDVPYGMPIADIATSTWPPFGPYSGLNDPQGNPYPGFGTEIYNSPYEISLYQGTRRGDDTLFTPDELEAMLRVFDIDSLLLSSRLLDFGVGVSSRHLVTTDSYEVPALPPTLFATTTGTVSQTIPERIYNILKANNLANGPPFLTHNQIFAQMRGGTPGPANVVHSLLSHEVMRGLPMNVNRIFGDGADNDGDGITDEHWHSNQPSENEAVSETVPLTMVGLDHNNDGASNSEDYFARQIFARHLFVLTWLTTSPGVDGSGNPRIPDMNSDGNNDVDDIEFLAQWCANVVDFRDADSICTPFKYDKNPWDGWDEHPDITSGTFVAPYDDSDTERGLVWGLERPELLITEALAMHERRYTENTLGPPAEPWITEYVPKASVFVELYNPQATNGNTESAPAEFYRAGGVDLGRHTNSLSGGGGVEDPVWRLAFTEERDDSAIDAKSRRVYFLEPNSDVEGNDDGYWYYPTSRFSTIQPNGYAVIGSGGVQTPNGDFRTTFGRRTDADELSDLKLDETRSITLIENFGIELTDGTDGANMITESRECVVIPIDVQGRGADYKERSLGITDPLAGYPDPDPNTGASIEIIDPDGNLDPSDGDGFKYKIPTKSKADKGGNNPVDTDGLTHGKRYVHLQRLANPEVAFDADTNPYLTVDVAPVDILSFNGLAATSDDVAVDGKMDFDSHERGETQNGVLGAWDANFDGLGLAVNDRVLWQEEMVRSGMDNRYDTLPPIPPINDLHFLSQEFEESFGLMNETYRGINATVSTKPFPWLMWNNRPYVSQYELVNVPMYRAREVLYNYTVDESDHLVKFNDTTLKRVFEFLEVPPRFVASEVGFLATAFNGDSPSIASAAVFNAPYNYTSRYRYPGKVNVNTMTDDQMLVWNSGMMLNWNVSYGKLTQVRGDRANDMYDPIRPDGVAAVDLPRAIDDPQTLSTGESDGSLLRTNASGVDHLFRTSTNPYDETARNNAFYSSSVTKLANISTNRSSVFAIWITVGYFEVDENGRVGAEVGSDTGEVTRNRGFYIFDRSIPMAFEPGKNHNVERGILVQSIIE